MTRTNSQTRPIYSFEGNLPKFNASYYINRIAKYSRAGPYTLVTALVYLERFQRACPLLRLTSRSVQRLLLVAVMVAEKYLEDEVFSNMVW